MRGSAPSAYISWSRARSLTPKLLGLIAKTFGYHTQTLSARIETTPASDERSLSIAAFRAAAPPKSLYCSFCGKSPHEVRKLIAWPDSGDLRRSRRLVQRHCPQGVCRRAASIDATKVPAMKGGVLKLGRVSVHRALD